MLLIKTLIAFTKLIRLLGEDIEAGAISGVGWRGALSAYGLCRGLRWLLLIASLIVLLVGALTGGKFLRPNVVLAQALRATCH